MVACPNRLCSKKRFQNSFKVDDGAWWCCVKAVQIAIDVGKRHFGKRSHIGCLNVSVELKTGVSKESF